MHWALITAGYAPQSSVRSVGAPIKAAWGEMNSPHAKVCPLGKRLYGGIAGRHTAGGNPQ